MNTPFHRCSSEGLCALVRVALCWGLKAFCFPFPPGLFEDKRGELSHAALGSPSPSRDPSSSPQFSSDLIGYEKLR